MGCSNGMKVKEIIEEENIELKENYNKEVNQKKEKEKEIDNIFKNDEDIVLKKKIDIIQVASNKEDAKEKIINVGDVLNKNVSTHMKREVEHDAHDHHEHAILPTSHSIHNN